MQKFTRNHFKMSTTNAYVSTFKWKCLDTSRRGEDNGGIIQWYHTINDVNNFHDDHAC